MTTQIDTQVALPLVEAELNYLAATNERPRNYTYDPPPGVPRSNSSRELHRVAIQSARPIEADVSLDREGFAVLHHASQVHDFYDDDNEDDQAPEEAQRDSGRDSTARAERVVEGAAGSDRCAQGAGCKQERGRCHCSADSH